MQNHFLLKKYCAERDYLVAQRVPDGVFFKTGQVAATFGGGGWPKHICTSKSTWLKRTVYKPSCIRNRTFCQYLSRSEAKCCENVWHMCDVGIHEACA